MKKSFTIAAIAASLLLVVQGTSNAGRQSPGGVTGGDRLRPGTWNRSARKSAPYRVRAIRPAQSEAGTYRSFSFEPGSARTTTRTTCCTPLPTCCAPAPTCVESSSVAPPAEAAPAPPGEVTHRSYSFEPQPAPVYRPRHPSSREDDRMYRKLHPGSGWRP